MSESSKLAACFCIAGFLGGCAAVVILRALFDGAEGIVPGLSITEALLMPIGAAAVTASISSRYSPAEMDWEQGIGLTMISFIVFSLVYAVLRTSYLANTLPNDDQWFEILFAMTLALIGTFAALVIFGGIFLGLPLIVMGAIAGHLFKLHTNQSNKAQPPAAGTH